METLFVWQALEAHHCTNVNSSIIAKNIRYNFSDVNIDYCTFYQSPTPREGVPLYDLYNNQ